jgi:hypothetical protein
LPEICDKSRGINIERGIDVNIFGHQARGDTDKRGGIIAGDTLDRGDSFGFPDSLEIRNAVEPITSDSSWQAVVVGFRRC